MPKTSNCGQTAKKTWAAAKRLHKRAMTYKTHSTTVGDLSTSTPFRARAFNASQRAAGEKIEPRGVGITKNLKAYSEFLVKHWGASHTSAIDRIASIENDGSTGVDMAEGWEISKTMGDCEKSEESDGSFAHPVTRIGRSKPAGILENLSLVCKDFQITPKQLLTQVKLLEEIQIPNWDDDEAFAQGSPELEADPLNDGPTVDEYHWDARGGYRQ
tara:strand:+ start:5157 stop:5801 length:645 start_codon:yes stop_codon:yes gene_type:complete